jgi:hypothetical protein
MPEEQFEAAVAKATSIAVAAVENDKAVIAAARAERHVIKQEHRVKREMKLAEKLIALPDKKYAVILADGRRGRGRVLIPAAPIITTPQSHWIRSNSSTFGLSQQRR